MWTIRKLEEIEICLWSLSKKGTLFLDTLKAGISIPFCPASEPLNAFMQVHVYHAIVTVYTDRRLYVFSILWNFFGVLFHVKLPLVSFSCSYNSFRNNFPPKCTICLSTSWCLLPARTDMSCIILVSCVYGHSCGEGCRTPFHHHGISMESNFLRFL